jgi:hypothetical protein
MKQNSNEKQTLIFVKSVHRSQKKRRLGKFFLEKYPIRNKKLGYCPNVAIDFT